MTENAKNRNKIQQKLITNLIALTGDKQISDCLYAERRDIPASSSQLITQYVHSSLKSSYITKLDLMIKRFRIDDVPLMDMN